jgi:hypothetical protein
MAGEASAKHMLVVVSNRPADIDQAVIDRMDMIIEVSLTLLWNGQGRSWDGLMYRAYVARRHGLVLP